MCVLEFYVFFCFVVDFRYSLGIIGNLGLFDFVVRVYIDYLGGRLW